MGLRSRAEGTYLPFQSKIDLEKESAEEISSRG